MPVSEQYWENLKIKGGHPLNRFSEAVQPTVDFLKVTPQRDARAITDMAQLLYGMDAGDRELAQQQMLGLKNWQGIVGRNSQYFNPETGHLFLPDTTQKDFLDAQLQSAIDNGDEDLALALIRAKRKHLTPGESQGVEARERGIPTADVAQEQKLETLEEGLEIKSEFPDETTRKPSASGFLAKYGGLIKKRSDIQANITFLGNKLLDLDLGILDKKESKRLEKNRDSLEAKIKELQTELDSVNKEVADKANQFGLRDLETPSVQDADVTQEDLEAESYVVEVDGEKKTVDYSEALRLLPEVDFKAMVCGSRGPRNTRGTNVTN